MHLVETYAVNCGAKIGKCFLYENYFPLPIDNFITFQAQGKTQAKEYSYWQDVIDILYPILLKEKISIVQFGKGDEYGYRRVIDLRGRTTFSQCSYLVKRAKLHFGPDSFGIHLASSFNVPLVSLYSSSSPEIVGPYFGDKNKQILFKAYERVGTKKPSYALQEEPKSIDKIKPEEIADAIFKLLNIDFKIPFKTIHIGEKYSFRFVRELLPDSNFVLPQPELPVEVRADLCGNLFYLDHHLSYLQKTILISDKEIDLQTLKRFKKNVSLFVYKITENNNPDFVAKVIELGIPVILTTELPKEQIEDKKIKYYKFGKINILPIPSEETINPFRLNLDKLYYRSCKQIASQGKMFGSHSAREKDEGLRNDYEYCKVVDSPTFWKDLPFYTIIEKID